ncbi:MAG TPA: hypothetical protein VKX41_14605 [Alloacidobacterium sp.]|nr:hypothetical protein [Alloacidobacterium sp.]
MPFTVPLMYSKRNLAFYIAAFLVLFSPFVWAVVDTGRWIERSLWHFFIASLFVLVAHLWLQHWQRNMIRERSGLLEDEDAEEFPQKLGIS